MEFKNKTVVITGGGKGIGEACAKVFFDDGANVAILDKDEPSHLYVDHRWFELQCNVADEAQVERAVGKILERFGAVHYLVNNAGIQRYGTAIDTTADEWDKVMNVNVKSYFICTKHFIPHMQNAGGGVVINIASVQAFVSQKNVAAYTTAKTAILGLTRSIAVDFGDMPRHH
jgi:NAD(P)-dependent dehydrogenase (short-subunit alcohol dehydrogenase family)